MPFPSYILENDAAGRALAHPLTPMMPERTVAVLHDIATGARPSTPDQQRILREVVRMLDAAEILVYRRTA